LLSVGGNSAGAERASIPAIWLETLFVCAEEEVVSAVRHKRLLTDIGGDKATVGRRQSASGVQALDKSGFGEELAAGWPLITSDRL
jgi:hypothetical protein